MSQSPSHERSSGVSATDLDSLKAPGLDRPYCTVDWNALPQRADHEAIREYIDTLITSNADAAIILYTDERGSREIARFDKRGVGHAEESIDIQSTTKALFMLYLLDLLKEELWTLLDKPIRELIGTSTLSTLELATKFRSDWKGKDYEAHWENLSLRQLLNHSSGLSSNHENTWFNPIPPPDNIHTRYSNFAVEIASFAIHEYLCQQNKGPLVKIFKEANQFLEKSFKAGPLPSGIQAPRPMNFYIYPDNPERLPCGSFIHLVGSGRAEGTVSQVAAIPVVVRTLGRSNIAKLFTPIQEHMPTLTSGVEYWPELTDGNATYWGNDLAPNIIANLFFLRPYGYATRGSFENNCDVVIQDYPSSESADERARSIVENPYFTVVRLQREPSGHGLDHGAQLQAMLGRFFLPHRLTEKSA